MIHGYLTYFYMIVRNVYNREFKLASSSMFVGINMLYN